MPRQRLRPSTFSRFKGIQQGTVSLSVSFSRQISVIQGVCRLWYLKSNWIPIQAIAIVATLYLPPFNLRMLLSQLLARMDIILQIKTIISISLRISNSKQQGFSQRRRIRYALKMGNKHNLCSSRSRFNNSSNNNSNREKVEIYLERINNLLELICSLLFLLLLLLLLFLVIHRFSNSILHLDSPLQLPIRTDSQIKSPPQILIIICLSLKNLRRWRICFQLPPRLIMILTQIARNCSLNKELLLLI